MDIDKADIFQIMVNVTWLWRISWNIHASQKFIIYFK